MLSFGKLYLLPVPISSHEPLAHIPNYNLEIIKQLQNFIAENAKTARAHLKGFGYTNISLAQIDELNQHSDETSISNLLNPLLNGYNVGLMSEAGCPAIADPGAAVIKLAHQKGIEVIALTGPSAIVLSIMASGFNGQNFAFVGYLPLERTAKIKRIKELETLSLRQKQAQFFIETPYRNDQIFECLLNTLLPDTLLFIGRDVCGPKQMMKSMTVSQWKKKAKFDMHKIPVVYGIYA